MNKSTLRYVLLVTLGVVAIGAVGAQTYYTHELVQRVSGQPDQQPSDMQPPADRAQMDPWAEMQRMQARMEQAFDHQFDAWPAALPADDARITLEQRSDSYIVKAAIPGASEGDIKVNLEGRQLSISAQTGGSEKQTGQNGSVTQQTTYNDAFENSFTLPGPVNASGMKSGFRNGVLTLTIPKAVS